MRKRITNYRKALAPSQAAALALRIKPALQAEAKRRQREHGLTAPGRAKRNAGNTARTRDLLSAACGFSGRTLEKAIAVVQAAAKDPNRYDHVVRQMDDTFNVDAAYRIVLGLSTRRLMREAEIFWSTQIGGVPLGDWLIPDLRWCVGFFDELRKRIIAADAGSVSKILTEALVRRAVARGDRMRRST